VASTSTPARRRSKDENKDEKKEDKKPDDTFQPFAVLGIAISNPYCPVRLFQNLHVVGAS
jgi:hypothetical protein